MLGVPARRRPPPDAVRARRIPADDDFARMFAALGESTRLRIMQLLPREPDCREMYNVVQLAGKLGLTQPTVSHHLKILAQAGLVRRCRKCNSIYYCVDQPAVVKWLRETQRRFRCLGCGE